MKNIKIDIGNVDHGDRERIVKWLRSGDSIGGDDMVARTIADAIERGADIEYERKQQIEQIVKSVAWLARKDVEYLALLLSRMSPTLPELYESGVKYDISLDGRLDIPTILADSADHSAGIESLVAWRVAELWRQGIQASPYIKWRDREGGGRFYTMVVQLPDGSEEDVIAKLKGR